MDHALVVDHISKEFSGRRVLENIHFSVREKSIHGFLGPNGAGKSTTINIIAGIIKPSRGQVLIFNENIDPRRRGIYLGLLPEHPPLYFNMKVEEYLRFVIDIFSLKKSTPTSFVDYIISTCGLKNLLGRSIGNLSKGLRQKTAIAAAVIHNPKIIIFDEPTVGLDPEANTDIRNLIKDLAKERTIILSSHGLHEVESLCDSVTVIHKGRLMTTGQIDSIKNSFAGQKKIVVKVKNWNEKYRNAMLALESIESMEVKKTHDFVILEIFCARREQSLDGILSNLVSLGLRISEFYEENLELEEIFRRITQ